MIGLILLLLGGLTLILFAPAAAAQWVGYTALFVIGLSYGYSRVLRSGLRVEREPGDLVVYRHQNATVRIRVHNQTTLPVPHLVIADNPGTLYSGNDNARLISLKARERISFSYELRGMNRGSYRIGPITVRYSDPLGMFPVTQTVREEVRMIVYPSIELVNVTMDRGLPAGTITAASRIYEDPTRYRSVREYTPGDEIRRISWRTTARTGRLHSVEYLPTLSFPVMVVLNLTAADYGRRHRYQHVERTIDAAASLIHRLAELGQPVGLVSTGTLEADSRLVMPWIPVSSDPGQAASLLGALAEIRACETAEPDIVTLFLEQGAVSFGTRVFYLGPPLDPDRVIALATGLGQRSLLRLHYTDESVVDWRSLAVEAVELYRITEYGRELFVAQA